MNSSINQLEGLPLLGQYHFFVKLSALMHALEHQMMGRNINITITIAITEGH